MVCDEFRMIDKEIVEKVLQPMLIVSRQPGFLKKPEYRKYKAEENKEIYNPPFDFDKPVFNFYDGAVY